MRKITLMVLITIVSISLACRFETETKAQNEPENVNSAQSKIGNKLTDHTESAQRMENIINIKENLKFNDEKPAVLSIINSEKLNLKVVGLKKGQIMSKHKAGLKSLLIVMDGKIEFAINGEKFELNKFDAYDIPVNIEHEIRGIEKSIFSLTQEK